MPSIRDFIVGSDDEKDEFANRVLGESIHFSGNLVVLVGKYAEYLPVEMQEEIANAINDYIGAVGEFVDVEAMYESINGEEDYDSAA